MSPTERNDDLTTRLRRRRSFPGPSTTVISPDRRRHGSFRALRLLRFATTTVGRIVARSGLACRYPYEITPNAPSVRLSSVSEPLCEQIPRGYRRTLGVHRSRAVAPIVGDSTNHSSVELS